MLSTFFNSAYSLHGIHEVNMFVNRVCKGQNASADKAEHEEEDHDDPADEVAEDAPAEEVPEDATELPSDKEGNELDPNMVPMEPVRPEENSVFEH